MKFFIDSADISEISKIVPTGLVDGITTNPSLIAKTGKKYNQVLKDICSLIDGPVSAEVTSLEMESMVEQGKKLADIAKNIVVKLPSTINGFSACKILNQQKIKVNVTLCFSTNQAIFAAKSGATYISPFVGRLDDIGENGMELIKDIKTIYNNYEIFTTEILVASIRTAQHVIQSAIYGADIVTVPPKVMYTLADHELTKKGLEMFLKDWKDSGNSI
jgi:transaldolase|tara:strand:+ start:727 stop:1380 length:654 start_codon:yes stop_codon:yes gene_type:complete